MKYSIIILCCIMLVGCGSDGGIYGVVEIIGVRDGVERVRGIGVCIGDATILTSAHVVRDDSMTYELRGTSLSGPLANMVVSERDMNTDIASIEIKAEIGNTKKICENYRTYIGKSKVTIGQNISIPVLRSGSLMLLNGSITSLTGTILAYDILGRTQLMSGVLMTDILLRPGDSGSPILDEEGRVVDVVHVE